MTQGQIEGTGIIAVPPKGGGSGPTIAALQATGNGPTLGAGNTLIQFGTGSALTAALATAGLSVNGTNDTFTATVAGLWALTFNGSGNSGSTHNALLNLQGWNPYVTPTVDIVAGANVAYNLTVVLAMIVGNLFQFSLNGTSGDEPLMGVGVSIVRLTA
jgi:hypothetical protein